MMKKLAFVYINLYCYIAMNSSVYSIAYDILREFKTLANCSMCVCIHWLIFQMLLFKHTYAQLLIFRSLYIFFFWNIHLSFGKHTIFWMSKLFRVLHNFNCWNEFMKLLTSYKFTSHIFSLFLFLFVFFFSKIKYFHLKCGFRPSLTTNCWLQTIKEKYYSKCNGNHLYGIDQIVHSVIDHGSYTMRTRRKKCDTNFSMLNINFWSLPFVEPTNRIIKQTSVITVCVRLCLLRSNFLDSLLFYCSISDEKKKHFVQIRE